MKIEITNTSKKFENLGLNILNCRMTLSSVSYLGVSFETDERVMFPSRLEAFYRYSPTIHSLQVFRSKYSSPQFLEVFWRYSWKLRIVFCLGWKYFGGILPPFICCTYSSVSIAYFSCPSRDVSYSSKPVDWCLQPGVFSPPWHCCDVLEQHVQNESPFWAPPITTRALNVRSGK